MKFVTNQYILIIFVTLFASVHYGQTPISPAQKAAVEDLQARVKTYVKLRDDIRGRQPKMPEKATKEQIQSFKDSFQRAVQAARPGSKQGDVITPQAADAIRYMIATAYTGEDRRRLRESVFEAENTAVPVRVNAAYPEAAEILETPPKLLLVLPQLPKQIRYRFVGGKLLLMDSENHLIIDYMANAVP